MLAKLYLIEILHQTTTEGLVWLLRYVLYLIEILHQTTTADDSLSLRLRLYLIEILHQTTTRRRRSKNWRALYLIEILHQTTTASSPQAWSFGCILSKFYIKPQPVAGAKTVCVVVSYRNSTSNHNGS